MFIKVLLEMLVSILINLKYLKSTKFLFEENKLINGSISEKVKNSNKDKKSARRANKIITFF